MRNRRQLFITLLLFVVLSTTCQEVKGAAADIPYKSDKSSTSLGNGTQSCKTDWIEYDGSCYKFMNKSSTTWVEAEKYCISENSHLASIHNEYENQFITDNIDRDIDYFYIGLRKQEKEWRWIDNSTSEFMAQWSQEAGNCVYLTTAGSGYWWSAECTRNISCICKKANDTANCVDNGDFYMGKFDGSCFLVLKSEHDWETCEEICKQEGTHLATITSREEYDVVIPLLVSTGYGLGWIGMRHYPVMKWTDNSTLEYERFGTNEPSGYGSCVYSNKNFWSDEMCDQPKQFVCKITGSARCKFGWDRFSSNCYYFSSETLDWYSAEKYCIDKSSHLVSILNETEENFIKSGTNDNSWIGINYLKFKNNWTDGTIYEYEHQYDNFPIGSPFGVVGCTTVYKDNTTLWWWEYYCSSPFFKANFICKCSTGAIFCDPKRSDPTNGSVICSNSNQLGSVCTYTCNDGFGLSNVSLSNTSCVDDGDGDLDGEWNSAAPECKAITCDLLKPTISNGSVTCTNINQIGSVCTYTCNEGYMLSDISLINTTCIDDGNDDTNGVWNSTAPQCKVAVCEEEHLPFPSNVTIIVTFPRTKAGYSTNSVDTCSETNNNNFYGHRLLCKESSEWDKPVWISSCDVQLEDLTITDPDDVNQVASDLVVITSQPENFTNSDVEVALDLVEDVLDVSPVVEQEIGNLLVESLNNLIEAIGTQSDDEATQTAKQTLDVLDQVSSSINVTQGDFSQTSSQVSVYVSSPGASQTRGLEFIPFKESDNTDSFRQGQIQPLTDCSKWLNNSNICLTFVAPTDNTSKLSFYAFLNDTIFKPAVGSSDKVNSEVVLSATSLGFNIETVQIKFKFKKNEQNTKAKYNYACAFWNETNLTWDIFGKASESEDSIDCQTDHLTNFAALFSELSEFGLDVVTIVGCSLSLLGQVATLVFYFKNKPKRRGKETVYASIRGVLSCNLAVALCLLNLLLIISEAPHIKKSSDGCQVIAIFLHFALISVFTWISADTFNIFLGTNFPLKYRFQINLKQFASVSFIVAWGIPALFIAASAGKHPEIYGGKNGQCWIIDDDWMKYLVVTPTSILLAFNLIMFACILYAARFKARPSGQKPNEKTETLGFALVLFFMVGGTWIIGFIITPLANLNYQAGLAFAYIFAILNSLQGAALFCLYYVRNSKEKTGKIGVKTATSSNITSKI